MKQKFIQLRLRAAMLFLLSCLTMTAQAEVTGDVHTDLLGNIVLYFSGTGEITEDFVESIDSYATAEELIIADGSSTSISIGHDAFRNCTALQRIYIPKTVSSIGTYAFYNCEKIWRIEFEEGTSTLTLDQYALYRSNQASSSQELQFYCYRPFTCTYVETWGNHPTGIFQSDKNLKSVHIGANVTEIPNFSFDYCTNLSEVYLSNATDLTTIGKEAFYGCAMTSVTIPMSVTSIGENAFEGNNNLATAYIKGYPTIDESAFPTWTNLVYDYPQSYEDWLNLYTDKENVTELFIPNDFVANYSAEYTKTANLHSQFPNVTKVTFGPQVTTIGDYIFYGSTSLQSVVIGSGVTSIGTYAFYNCSMESIELPSSVSTIGQGAFCKCTSLKTIEIPESLTSLKGYVFAGCTSLNNVVIPANITFMANNTFKDCSALTDLTINSDAVANPSTAYTTTGNLVTFFPYVKNLTFGDAVTAISENAMTNSTTLQSLVIGSGVTTLPTTAFSGCAALTKLDIESATIPAVSYTADANLADQFPNLTDLTLGEKVTVVGDYCFSFENTEDTYPLANVTFKGTPEIGKYAFEFNKSLTTITGAVKTVGYYSFWCCVKLTSITITNDEEIDIYAFGNCHALESVSLPSNLTAISADAFFYCNKLNNVIIPAGVTFIGKEAFRYCTDLKQLTCLREKPVTLTTNQNVFSGVTDCELDVPYSAISDYKSAEVWKDFYDIFASDGLKLADGEEYTQSEETVEYPVIRYTRTFNYANTWNALYLPFSIDVTDYTDDFDIAEIWTIAPVSDTNGDGSIDGSDDFSMIVNIKKTGNTVANRPYLIRPKTAGSYKIYASELNGTPVSYKSEENSVTCSTTYNEYVIKGLYSPLSTSAYDGNYYMSASGSLSYRTSGTGSIKPNRWVMNIKDKDGYSSESNSQAKFRVIAVGEDIDETTAIGYINGDFDSSNSSDDVIYNLNGIKMSNSDNLHRGIYIKNGKKVVVK